MKLNWVETLAMNNPVRAFVERHYEAPALERLAPGRAGGGDTLVIGCGRGVDVEIAFERFKAATVTAFDLDPAQVARARARLANRFGDRLTLQVGDAAAMPFPDGRFDLVLDFGIVHHIPEWQKAVGEVARVLKPGGLFLFEEIGKNALDSLLFRITTDHPRDNRFHPDQFFAQCGAVGLALDGRTETLPGFFRGAAAKRPAS